MKNKFVRITLVSLKNSVITLCRLDFTVETAVTELGILNAMGVIGFLDGRAQKEILSLKTK